MATGRPSLSSTARRMTVGGMAIPTVAMRTAEDCVGCLSHFALLKNDRVGRERGSSDALRDGALAGASASIGGVALRWADTSGLHVDGIHLRRVQDVRLLHLAEVNATW